MEFSESKIESHEQLLNRVIFKHFNEAPISIDRMKIGLCNEVYNIKLSDREVIARLSSVTDYIQGSQKHIPILKKIGIAVPDILFEDYSKIEIPYAYQILSKIAGQDIDLVIGNLSDDELDKIANEISIIFDKTKDISNNDKFGVSYGNFVDFSDSWTERMKIWIDETIERGNQTGVLDEKMKSILFELFDRYEKYFDQIKPTTYLSDICSKNVMISDGKFMGVVDLDGLTQGDPLEAIGRIKCSWPGTHYGEVYINALMDKQNLNDEQRKMVLVYALLNRIAWTCENGIKFNENTSGIVNREKEKKDKAIIDLLYREYCEIKL